jgi:hypothetical protein
MATNVYFNNFNYPREQDLVEDLTIEAIKVYGHNVKYIPGTMVNVDNLFGEDLISKFEEEIGIEMYIKNVEGFEGQGDLFSRFGLEIRDEITFTVARKRFDQAISSPKLLTQVGYNLIFEDGSTKTPSRQFLTQSKDTHAFMLEGDDYINTLNRPMEGDIIFFPLVQKLFEIKFVEHEQIFYQTGRLQTYDLKCELLEYSSERFTTGNTAIDSVQSIYSLDTLIYQFNLEHESGVIKTQDDGTLLQEFSVESTDRSANNSLFQTQADNILDFSESNPFSEIDRY